MLNVLSCYVPALALWSPGSFLVEFVNKAWCVSSFTTGVMPESGIAPPVPLGSAGSIPSIAVPDYVSGLSLV